MHIKSKTLILSWAIAGLAFAEAQAQDASIIVQTDRVQHRVSRYLTGACLEDVNHEVYGGIDSQMIFGESFAEPARDPELRGFTAYGGRWTLAPDNTLRAAGGDGPKLILNESTPQDGEVSVDILFTSKAAGNAGLILKVARPGRGADRFDGYEVSLEPSGMLVLGRHRQNWEALQRVSCNVPLNEWVNLRVEMKGRTLEAFVNGKSITRIEDTEHPLSHGAVGLRTWQIDAHFRNLTVRQGGGSARPIPFAYVDKEGSSKGVSGMWRAMRRGTAVGEFSLAERQPFSGEQSQTISFLKGAGEIGVENQGLNRWGMNLVKGRPCEGYVWARAASATEVFVAFESRDGTAVYAEKRLKLKGGDWQRLDFTLKPDASDKTGRFAVKLKRPGAVTLGYAFLQPGPWGRFKNLPVRKDVAEGLIDQGITVLRLGGCMANATEYRWKKMIGPRAFRPPYNGWWYPHSSNGWGIFDFLNFCEAAGFLAVPDVNVDETPQDMTDFVEYVNGSKDTKWGAKRAQDGHPKPYRLKYLQIGNEEKVNEAYWQKFKPIAEAVWAADPNIILIIGDFAYSHQINDPFQMTGAAGGITSLAAHQKILQLAKAHNREVWFDIHVSTDGPRPDFGGTMSYIDSLEKIADGAKHRVVIFEFNAGNHAQRRALANAAAINMVERDGRIPIAASANCLQPDGQNDNDWNQGLLFLNPSQVWLQPPGYVTRMYSRNYQPLVVESMVRGAGEVLDVNAKRSHNGKTLVLQVVNTADHGLSAKLQIEAFRPSEKVAQVEVLSGSLDTVNTALAPKQLTPSRHEWTHNLRQGETTFTFAPHSVTVIQFE